MYFICVLTQTLKRFKIEKKKEFGSQKFCKHTTNESINNIEEEGTDGRPDRDQQIRFFPSHVEIAQLQFIIA